MAAMFEHDGTRTRGAGRKVFWVIVLAGGALALSHFTGCGRHWGSCGWHGRGGHGQVLTEEEARKKLDRAADRFLSKAEATPEQRAAVSGMLGHIAKDWVDFQKERKEIAGEIAEALSADRIDPVKSGTIRKKTEELASRAAGKAVETTFRLAETLGPEQRKKIVEEWKEKR